MNMRIVLSMLVVGVLAGLLLGYANNQAHAQAAPPPGDNGIGTSPSVEVQAYPEVVTCGIWLDSTPERADARSRAGEPPDVVVSPTLYASCWDAVMIGANLYPGRSFVRAVAYQGWRAREAPVPHAALQLAAPVEWRAAALQRSLPIPAQAAFPWLVILEILSPLVTTVVAKLFHSAVKDTSRQAEILSYANTAFQVVEALGPQYGLGSNAKYSTYIEQIFDALKAAGRPEPTAAEMEMLKQLARDKSILAKPVARPLPLPPPLPRG